MKQADLGMPRATKRTQVGVFVQMGIPVLGTGDSWKVTADAGHASRRGGAGSRTGVARPRNPVRRVSAPSWSSRFG